MSRRLALACLLLLGACHRSKVADVTLDADRAAENATAAKTLADIAAAEEAARTPLPPRQSRAATADTPAPEADNAVDAPIEEPVVPGNSAAAVPQ